MQGDAGGAACTQPKASTATAAKLGIDGMGVTMLKRQRGGFSKPPPSALQRAKDFDFTFQQHRLVAGIAACCLYHARHGSGQGRQP